MMSPMSDDQLLNLLDEALLAEPSSRALDAAYGALAWCELNHEIARLVDDACFEVVAFDQAQPTHARMLAYQSSVGSIEMGIDDDQVEITLRPSAAKVVVVTPSSRWEPVLDGEPNLGTARLGGLSGPLRVEITWAAQTVATPWITI